MPQRPVSTPLWWRALGLGRMEGGLWQLGRECKAYVPSLGQQGLTALLACAGHRVACQDTVLALRNPRMTQKPPLAKLCGVGLLPSLCLHFLTHELGKSGHQPRGCWDRAPR